MGREAPVKWARIFFVGDPSVGLDGQDIVIQHDSGEDLLDPNDMGGDPGLRVDELSVALRRLGEVLWPGERIQLTLSRREEDRTGGAEG